MYSGGASNIGSSQIVDGEIINADINESAGIVRSKLASNVFSKTFGVASKNLQDASGQQTIAHGLGRIPVRVKFYLSTGGYGGILRSCFGVYDGTNQKCVYAYAIGQFPSESSTFTLSLASNGADVTTTGQRGVVSFDGTNIIIDWTKAGSPNAETLKYLWEAE